MRFVRTLIAAIFAVALPAAAIAQVPLIQGGTWVQGHGPVYYNAGGVQAYVVDSGGAAGGPAGTGYSEFLLQAQGTGTAPYSAQGSGPLGTVACMFDAPASNSTGVHYFCFSPNISGNQEIVTGKTGSQTVGALVFNINGVATQIPATGFGSQIATESGSFSANQILCAQGTTGIVVGCSGTPVFPNVTANLVFAGPSSGPAAAPTFRTLVAADVPACTALTSAGNVCTYNVGTSGATVPLLNGVNTWSAQQTFALGTITTSQPILITETWNAAVTFAASGVEVVEGPSNAASVLWYGKVGAVTVASINKAGTYTVANGAAQTATFGLVGSSVGFGSQGTTVATMGWNGGTGASAFLNFNTLDDPANGGVVISATGPVSIHGTSGNPIYFTSTWSVPATLYTVFRMEVTDAHPTDPAQQIHNFLLGSINGTTLVTLGNDYTQAIAGNNTGVLTLFHSNGQYGRIRQGTSDGLELVPTNGLGQTGVVSVANCGAGCIQLNGDSNTGTNRFLISTVNMGEISFELNTGSQFEYECRTSGGVPNSCLSVIFEVGSGLGHTMVWSNAGQAGTIVPPLACQTVSAGVDCFRGYYNSLSYFVLGQNGFVYITNVPNNTSEALSMQWGTGSGDVLNRGYIGTALPSGGTARDLSLTVGGVPAVTITNTTLASVFAGKLTTLASASGGAGFNLPHGAAPASPVNGDLWTTTGGVFARVNGVTVTLSSSALTATYPLNLSGSAFTSVAPTQSGYLSVSSTTLLLFAPQNGDTIRIAGVVYQIPAAGITGCANTSVFVNGVGASNLAATTLYYVYAFNNSGTITCDFSTTTHATSSTAGNIGTEVESGDNTRTLVGMTYTDASSHFLANTTVSWFNRRARTVAVPNTANRSLGTTAAWTEVSSALRASFVSWANEASECRFIGTAFLNTTTDSNFMAMGFDGTTPTDTGAIDLSGNLLLLSGVANGSGVLSEGNHYCTLLSFSAVGSGGGGVQGGATSAQRGAVVVGFRG